MTFHQEKSYKHAIFQIGETLVDVDKRHISAEKACEKIRKCLQELNVDLNIIESCASCRWSVMVVHPPREDTIWCFDCDAYVQNNSWCNTWVKK